MNDRRFVVKTLPEAYGAKKEFLENNPMFDNEIQIYTQTLPALEDILAKTTGEKKWWPR